MKLFTYTSPSHAKICADHLLQSTQDFTVQVFQGEQLSEGYFGCRGWGRSTQDRVRKLYEGMESLDDGEVFVWADADTVFFDLTPGLILERLGLHDAAYQRGRLEAMLCSGFFVMRRTDRTLDFMRAVRDDAATYSRAGLTDQRVTNQMKDMIDWVTLPVEQYWTIGHLPRDIRRELRSLSEGWRRELRAAVPPGIRLYHANFIVSVEDKCKLLSEVRRIVAERISPLKSQGTPATHRSPQ